MTRPLALLLVVLAISLIEGLWVWLLGGALSELDGHAGPPLWFPVTVVVASWLLARVLAIRAAQTLTRQLVLVGGGLLLALATATVHAGLAAPLQLVLGHPEPDHRASGVVVGLLTAYLWARGLGLAVGITRRRLIGHIGVSTFMVANLLFALPLSPAVQQAGLPVVIATFSASLAALLLLQLAHTESRRLTRTQWVGLGVLATAVLVVGAGALAAALASGFPAALAQTLTRGARPLLPVTNAVLLGLGYVAQAVTYFLIFLRELRGVDPAAVQRAQEEAERARPRFEAQDSYSIPEVMTVVAALFVLALVVWWLTAWLLRLAQLRAQRADNGILETRRAVPLGPLVRLRSALARLPGLGPSDDGLGGRAAEIRRQYRAFQALMARARLPRREPETPAEYEELLARRLPQAAAPVDRITDAYIRARYGDPGAPLPDPDQVAAAIRQVRAALQTQPPKEQGRGGQPGAGATNPGSSFETPRPNG